MYTSELEITVKRKKIKKAIDYICILLLILLLFLFCKFINILQYVYCLLTIQYKF
jgi:hypothetical protein